MFPGMTSTPDTPPAVRRREFLLEPGEPPLLSRSPIVAGERFGRFCQVTGLDPGDVSSSPLAAFPAPRYRGSYPGGRRRPPGVRAEAMWHPLMWLPRRLGGRAVLERAPDGTPTLVENTDEWLVRVGLEVGVSGLYDQASGGWVDVLALHGLDVADPAVLERIERWLAGGDDEVLDGVDLEEHLAVQRDPWWSLVLATELVPLLTECAWALGAQALAESVDDLVLDGPEGAGWSGRTTQSVAAMLAALAAAHLPEPQDGPTWEEMARQMYGFDGTTAELTAGPLARFAADLRWVRDTYSPRLAELDPPARQD